MQTALGLFELLLFIIAVIALAAGVTWAIVEISPKPKGLIPKPQLEPTTDEGGAGGKPSVAASRRGRRRRGR
jgi:hypothetical protein